MESTLPPQSEVLKPLNINTPPNTHSAHEIHPLTHEPLPKPTPVQAHYNEVIKAKQVIEEEKAASSSSGFTPEEIAFFKRVGIDAAKMNSKPLGVGANHTVFEYHPDEQTVRVVKVERTGGALSKMNKNIPEQENIQLMQTHFGNYFPKTEIMEDPQTHLSCVIQDMVQGEVLTDKNYTPALATQLAEIAASNRALRKERDISLDFVGMHGFFNWIKKQTNKLIFKRGAAEVANILIDKQGKLWIIDSDFYRYITNRLFSSVAGFFTKVFMKHYFDVTV